MHSHELGYTNATGYTMLLVFSSGAKKLRPPGISNEAPLKTDLLLIYIFQVLCVHSYGEK